MNWKAMMRMGYNEAESCPLLKSSKSKKIKVSAVCFEKTVQSINDLIISAPIGVDIDDLTGKLNSKTHIEIVSKPNLAVKLENCLLIIEGLLPVKIVFENPKPCPCTDVLKSICQETTIPIQTVLSIKDCTTSDHKLCDFNCNDAFSIQTKAKVISTSIFGYPNIDSTVAGKQIKLVVKAILEITAYILEDEIINLFYL